MTLRSVVPILGISALILTVALGVLFAIANRMWRSQLRDLDMSLERAAVEGAGVEWIPIEELPGPVLRFRQRVVEDDAAEPILMARLWQSGEIQMGEGEAGWRQFEAVEAFTTSPPAFYWNATIRMIPFIPVRVRDAFVEGEGSMNARVGGVISVMNLSDSPELTEGSLARYLAEGPWFPTRLLTGPGLSWMAVSGSEADATLETGGVRVTLRFTFDEEGAITRVSGFRPREVDGHFERSPWVGRFSDHRTLQGEWIPTWGEVAWVLDGVEVPYWRGAIERAEYLRQAAPAHYSGGPI